MVLSIRFFRGWVFDVADGSDAGGIGSRARTRKPLLGRMSVFLIGLVLGIGLGVAGAFVGASLIDGLDPSAFASAPALPAIPVKAPLPKVKPTPAQAVVAAAPPPAQLLHVSAGRPVVIGVFGDSLGDGLWAGLYRQLRDGKSYEVVKFSRAATGLARYDYVNLQEQAADQLSGRHIDVAVIMVGANDEQGIIEGGGVDGFATQRWRQIYTGRIDALVNLLKSKGVAVYWVGLPRMRRELFDQRAQFLNALYAARAQALGVPFIPTVPVTVDGQGGYDDYLNDAGRPRLMRAKDGVHMTMAGYLRIAQPVSTVIRADVGRALKAQAPQVRAEAGGAAAGAAAGG